MVLIVTLYTCDSNIKSCFGTHIQCCRPATYNYLEMSSLGPPSSESESPAGSVSSDALAAAAELRTRQAVPQLTAAQMAAEHEKRQKFRRLLDPGITRPNSKEQALRSLKVGVLLIFCCCRSHKTVLDSARHNGESTTRAG